MEVYGSWLIDTFSAATGSVQLDAIPINASTGAYTGSGPEPSQAFNVTNASTIQMALSPDGTNLFVALQTGGTIVVPFTSGNSNPLGSQATVIPVVNSSGSAVSVAVDPTNRLFYIGETLAVSASGGLRVFSYSSLGTGSPRSAPTQITVLRSRAAEDRPAPFCPRHLVITSTSPTGRAIPAPEISNGFRSPFREPPIRSLRAAPSPRASSPIVLPKTAKITLFLQHHSATTRVSAAILTWKPSRMSSGALTANIASATGTDPVGAVAVAALP